MWEKGEWKNAIFVCTDYGSADSNHSVIAVITTCVIGLLPLIIENNFCKSRNILHSFRKVCCVLETVCVTCCCDWILFPSKSKRGFVCQLRNNGPGHSPNTEIKVTVVVERLRWFCRGEILRFGCLMEMYFNSNQIVWGDKGYEWQL